MKPLLRQALGFVLAAILLYFAFRGADLEELWSAMKSAHYSWLVLMFFLLMVSHVLRSWRWRYLLEPIKPGIGLRNLFSGVIVGYFVNNILPRAGELVRPYAIGRLEMISKSTALGTIVVERIMDGASFLILLALLPLVYDGPLHEEFPWLSDSGMVLALILFGFLAAGVVLMLRRDWTTRLVALAGRILPPSPGKFVERVAHSFLDGFLFLKHPKNYLVIILLSVGVWLLYIAMTYSALVAFDLHQRLGWRGAVVVLTISSIGVAVPTPGSTGSYHVFTSQTLSRLFFVPDEISLGFATLTHGVAYLGITLTGLYFFLRDHIKISDAVKNQAEVRS